MEKEIIERVNKIPLNKLMEDVWPPSLCLMRDCYWIAFWETEDIENAYTQEGSEDFEGFVKRVIASELENEKPDDDGFMYLNVDFAIAEAECNKALNPTSDSKRAVEERKQIIKLRHWSEQKEDYIDAVVCGVNCDCSDLECKF